MLSEQADAVVDDDFGADGGVAVDMHEVADVCTGLNRGIAHGREALADRDIIFDHHIGTESAVETDANLITDANAHICIDLAVEANVLTDGGVREMGVGTDAAVVADSDAVAELATAVDDDIVTDDRAGVEEYVLVNRHVVADGDGAMLIADVDCHMKPIGVDVVDGVHYAPGICSDVEVL